MSEEKKELLQRVIKIIDQLRPFLESDGGDIEVLGLTDDNMVKVKLLGACYECPFSQQTLKGGIEQALKKEIPEINGVIAIQTAK